MGSIIYTLVTLGTECVEYLKAAKASEGNPLSYTLLLSSAFLCFFIRFSSPFVLTTDALEAANARISSLEAELEASRKAWGAATAAKTNAKKATKSALAKAKKAEKALSDANKGYL
jgi:hypothetical protein